MTAADLGLEELSERTRVPLERLRRWLDLGLIGRSGSEQFDARDVARADVVRDLVRLGVEPEAIARAAGRPNSEFERLLNLCEVDYGLPVYSLAQAAEVVGLEIDQLRRLVEVIGIQRPGDLLDDVDIAALQDCKAALDAGYPEDGLLQLLRVYADALSRAADATQRTTHFYLYDRMKASGVPEAELGEKMDAAQDALDPLVEPAILYFFRKGMARAAREDVLVHLAGQLGGQDEGEVVGQFQAAVVFVDLSSFTPLAEAMGDEKAAEVLQRFSSLVRRAADHQHGRVVKQIGDAFMLIFSDVRSALVCALDIEARSGEEPQFSAVRSGVHWGPVLYREGDYVGATVNLASRLAGTAARHAVLVTSDVRRAASGLPGVEFVPLGKRRLKGLASEEALFEVRLEGVERAEKVIDPVCGMELGQGEVAARLSSDGVERMFCSDECLRRFVAAPERYAE